MDNLFNFVDLCKTDYLEEEFVLIKKAVDFAKLNLLKKKEFFDKSFFDFNLEVGEILARSKLPVQCVVAGILYGIESVFSFNEIEKEFGSDVSGLIFGQLQFRKIRKRRRDLSGELFRKILLSGLDDVRIVFVKLAVKLANLRIISGLSRDEQKRIAEDVLDIYVPLASRLGLDYIKRELEDLAFKAVHPRKYKEILNFFKESRDERKEFLNEFILKIRKLIGPKVSLVRVGGRDKPVASIYRKITDRGVSLEKQKDHFAVRVIVKNREDCYCVLAVLHEEFLPVEGRLKDYIASPKLNGYQSLHTVVRIGDGSKEVEVQIRTVEMDEEAEEGGSAHWRYKGGKSDFNFERKVGWMRAVMESRGGVEDSEFIKNLKGDLFADKIYCYTPKGDVRELPNNSTLLDFAYSIHQEVGERAVGGRIDGKFVSLKNRLENGAVVEILTNKNQRPRRAWLKFVISARAKSKIRKGIRRYDSIPIPKKSSIRVEKRDDFANLVESIDFSHGKFSFAKCCYPLPRCELIGVAKSHRKVLVHRADCERVGGAIKNAVIVNWKDKFNRPLGMKVLCRDRSGILADLLNTISRLGFVVKNANAKVVGNEEVECSFGVIPREIGEVERLVGRVKNVRGVLKVWFE